MSTGAIHVLRPGLQSTVQDLGRWGFQAYGVSVAGPMDPFSHRMANALVGNQPTAATLEVTMTGPELEFEDERLVAVTGAIFALTVDDAAVSPGAPFVVGPHARLRFGHRLRGARAYLAVSGGLDVPLLLGSRATHVPSAMGGFFGRAIARGDRLAVGSAGSIPGSSLGSRRPPLVRAVKETPALPADLVVRVLPGPQLDRFADEALDVLQSVPYELGGDSDRMGFRLIGPALPHKRGADIISDATSLGALQVPGSGQPILLMADRPTTGGYAKVATAITADIGIAGQAAPGDRLAFKVCTPAEALSALVTSERLLMALEAAS